MLAFTRLTASVFVPFASTMLLAEAVSPDMGIIGELARQVPGVVGVIVVTTLFLRSQREDRKSRDEAQKLLVDKIIELTSNASDRIEDLTRDTQKKNQEMAQACHDRQRDADGRYQMLVDAATKTISEATIANRLLDETLKGVKEELRK